MNKRHTNILVLNVPLRYDLHNYSQRNLQISELNSKLKQLCSHLTHTAFLHINNDRQLFTSHGLHLNKTGKRLRNYHVALQTLTLFNIQTRTLTPFDSQPPLTVDTPSTYILNTSKNNNNNTTQNTHQSRISKWHKKPANKLDDFLWWMKTIHKQNLLIFIIIPCSQKTQSYKTTILPSLWIIPIIIAIA